MEEIDWNIMGRSNIKKTFVIKIPKEKKWWQFWKKSREQLSREALKNIASRYNEEIVFPDGLEITIPANNTSNIKEYSTGTY